MPFGLIKSITPRRAWRKEGKFESSYSGKSAPAAATKSKVLWRACSLPECQKPLCALPASAQSLHKEMLIIILPVPFHAMPVACNAKSSKAVRRKRPGNKVNPGNLALKVNFRNHPKKLQKWTKVFLFYGHTQYEVNEECSCPTKTLKTSKTYPLLPHMVPQSTKTTSFDFES